MTTTSPNFGPLTTTFTPPADCFSEQWIEHNTNSTVLAWGPTCDAGRVGYATSCYPPGWSGSKANDNNLNYKAFSPGLMCPSGFNSTFSASHIMETKSFLLSEYVTNLGRDDVATVCCPFGYGFDGDLCTSNTLVLTARPIITVTDNKCTTKTAADYNGVIGKHGQTGDATLQAKPVILIRNTVSDPVPTTTSTSTTLPGASHSSGLSTGAKIAIGVCVPVVILLVAAAAFIFWHRRRRAKNGSEIQLRSQASPVAEDPFLGKPELDGGVVGAAGARPDEKMELDAGATDGVWKHELASGEVVWKKDGVVQPPAELPEAEPVELPVENSPTSPRELGDVQGFRGMGPVKEQDEHEHEHEHERGDEDRGNGRDHEDGST